MHDPWRRIFDVLVAALALLVTSPLLLITAIAIAIESRGGVFFRQGRVGRDGRDFDVIKLRTMVDGAEQIGAGLAVDHGDARITRVGSILRRTSIDELPNLVNVLRGEMSIIGPRPTVRSQVDRYTERQRGRLALRPGITGWAQVNGRASLPWSERIELDLWYSEHRSTWLDLKILGRTALIVLGGGGLYRGATGGWEPGAGPAVEAGAAPTAAVFWRRRAVAALALVAFVVLLVFGVRAVAGAGGDREPEQAAVLETWEIPDVPLPAWLDPKVAIDRAIERLSVLRVGGRNGREIALTFDDGPAPLSTKVVRTLRKYGAHATFFQVGTMIEDSPGKTRWMARQPDVELGNHTHGHARLDLLGADEQRGQIDGGTIALQSAGAPKPRLFRPPYGATNETTIKVAEEAGMLPVNWSIDSRDYAGLPAGQIAAKVIAEAQPGAIVLLHDGGGDRRPTLAALPTILKTLKKRGYRFVTVSELLTGNPPPRAGNGMRSGSGYTPTGKVG